MILVDTGPIVALLREREHHHEWSTAQFKSLSFPIYTCEAVITEAAYLLQGVPGNLNKLFELLVSGALEIHFEVAPEAEALAALIQKYASVPMDFADACLVRIAELNPGSTILTLDSDFHIYRKHRTEALSVVAPV